MTPLALLAWLACGAMGLLLIAIAVALAVVMIRAASRS